jgi:hypothetical protein
MELIALRKVVFGNEEERGTFGVLVRVHLCVQNAQKDSEFFLICRETYDTTINQCQCRS